MIRRIGLALTIAAVVMVHLSAPALSSMTAAMPRALLTLGVAPSLSAGVQVAHARPPRAGWVAAAYRDPNDFFIRAAAAAVMGLLIERALAVEHTREVVRAVREIIRDIRERRSRGDR